MEKGTDPRPTWQLMTKCNRSRSGNYSERADGQMGRSILGQIQPPQDASSRGN